MPSDPLRVSSLGMAPRGTFDDVPHSVILSPSDHDRLSTLAVTSHHDTLMRAYDARRAIDAVAERHAAAERVEYRPRHAREEESPRPWRQRSRATLDETDEARARATRAAREPNLTFFSWGV